MKKVMMMVVMAMITLTASAQFAGVKMQAKYQKGDCKEYKTSGTMAATGQQISFSATTRYTVTEASTQGYTVEQVLQTFDTDAKDGISKFMTLAYEMFKGVKVVLAMDADGKVIDIKNFDEVKAVAEKSIGAMLDEIKNQNPEVASSMPVDALKDQLSGLMTKERLMTQIGFMPSPFALNGKTISSGMMEDAFDENGLKVKKMYFLSSPDGKKVKETSTLNMSKDEMKKFIIDTVKKMAPDQASMIEQNIDLVMQSGMVNVEGQTTVDYEFLDNGWVKTVSLDNEQKMMGQNQSLKSTTEVQ